MIFAHFIWLLGRITEPISQNVFKTIGRSVWPWCHVFERVRVPGWCIWSCPPCPLRLGVLWSCQTLILRPTLHRTQWRQGQGKAVINFRYQVLRARARDRSYEFMNPWPRHFPSSKQNCYCIENKSTWAILILFLGSICLSSCLKPSTSAVTANFVAE